MENFSCPTSRLNKKHLTDLQNSGLSPKQAAMAGHFSADRDEAWKLVGYKQPGLIFQYSNINGQPFLKPNGSPFYRIKPDWETHKTEDSPKYLSPEGAGCRPYFSKLYPDWEKAAKSPKVDLWETEGEKKGDCGCAYGLTVIAFSGVDGWLDRCDRTTGVELSDSRVLPELDCIIWQNRRVNQCFDSDIVEKIPVQQALARRAKCLQELGAIPYLIPLPNEMDGSKNGMDDFIIRHGVEALKVIEREAEPTPIKIKTVGTAGTQAEQILLDLREPESHGKAILAWSVLKERWAFRPKIGWYEWRGTHWKLSSEEELEVALTQFMDAQNWKKRSSGIMTSVVRELRSRLTVPAESWQPFNKIAFTNGTLDTTSGQFESGHQPTDRITQARPFAFDLTAECPIWHSFLDVALGRDQGLINLIQAIFRRVVLPQPKDRKFEIEKSFDFFGPKGTGKGTTLDVLTNLVGLENIGPAGVDTFKNETGLGQLIDKTLAIDYDASGFLNNVGYFNRVVSNEPVPVKKLYRDTFTTRLGVVVVRAYNAFISVPEGSEGLDRRITVVPFKHRPQLIDPNLAQKLESELPGIFAWCYSISSEEMKSRLLSAGKLPAIAEASIDRFEANNPEIRFLTEVFPDGACSIRASELYERYQDWCKKNGHQPKSNVKFRPAVERFGCKRTHKTNGCYYYAIPQMSGFDVAIHLGIVDAYEGIVGEQLQDSSNLAVEQDRDGCRQLPQKNNSTLQKAEHEIEQEIQSKLSTTIPNPCEVSSSANSEPSLTLPPACFLHNKQVGDRVRYIGKRYAEQYRELELIIYSIHGQFITCQKPDGYLTTQISPEELKVY